MTKFQKYLSTSKNILISTHFSPDGDAIGSATFLSHVLKNMGKKALVILPDSPPKFLQYFLNDIDFMIFEETVQDDEFQNMEFDLIFHLDYNALNRLGPIMSNFMTRFEATQIMIDHHPNPNLDVDLMFSNPEYSSTCELLFDILKESDLLKYINTSAARSCYLGIMTDTGSFRYPSVTSNTHKVIQFLMDLNIEHFRIHEIIYDSNNIQRLKLKGYAISEKLNVIDGIGMGIIDLSMSELEKFDYSKGDTEGLVNVILSVEGLNIAALLIEKEDGIKLSFRSKGKYFVNEFAKNNFSGGGHKYAAGGFSHKTLEETISDIERKANEYFN